MNTYTMIFVGKSMVEVRKMFLLRVKVMANEIRKDAHGNCYSYRI